MLTREELAATAESSGNFIRDQQYVMCVAKPTYRA